MVLSGSFPRASASLKSGDFFFRLFCGKNIFLQVKLRDDPQKGGFLKQDLLKNWSKIVSLKNIHLIGLMTIPPIALNFDQRKDLFYECRNLANHLELNDCSMGMSNDWQEALECGATWIRLGSLLFGKRKD